jgi:flavin-binding protein dodecin
VPVLNTIELEGASPESWAAAAHEALREAAKTLRHIQRMDVLGTSVVIDASGTSEYRARVRLLFQVDRTPERLG